MQRLSHRLTAISPHELRQLALEGYARAGGVLRRMHAADLRRLIAGTEIALTVVLAAVAGNLVWDVFEPPAWAAGGDIARVSQPPRRAALPVVLTDVDPFHRAVATTATVSNAKHAPETMLNLQLFGIRAGLNGAPGSAIIGTPDNQQDVYFVGQDIMPGVRLEDVTPDRVTIRRNGVTEALSFDRATTLQQASLAPAAPAAPPVASPVASVEQAYRLDLDTMKAFAMLLRFSPAERDGTRGLLLEGSADPSVLEQTGLETGDFLLSVNGTSVADMGALASLAASGAQGLTLEIERKGQRKFHRLAVDRVQ